jgi:hypothetical protein
LSLPPFETLTSTALGCEAFIVVAGSACNASFYFIHPWENNIALIGAEFADESSSGAELKLK